MLSTYPESRYVWSYAHLRDGHNLLIRGKFFPFLHLSETIPISHVVEDSFQKNEMFLSNYLTALTITILFSSMSLFYPFSEMKNAAKCQWNEKSRTKTTILSVKTWFNDIFYVWKYHKNNGIKHTLRLLASLLIF